MNQRVMMQKTSKASKYPKSDIRHWLSRIHKPTHWEKTFTKYRRPQAEKRADITVGEFLAAVREKCKIKAITRTRSTAALAALNGWPKCMPSSSRS